MPTERFIEPAVVQALESTQEELRAAQHALGALPREHAELRERLEKLGSERGKLLGELEGLKKGPRKAPRLPERLEVPFELQPWRSSRLLVREFVPPVVLLGTAGMVMALADTRRLVEVGFFSLLMLFWMLNPAFERRRKQPRWRFGESALEEHVTGTPPVVVSYADILEAEVSATYSQHRRGVGSVVVRCKPKPGESQGQSLTLKDMPEPERLAEWIRSKRTSGA